MSNTVVRARQYPLIAVSPVMGIANIGAGLGYDFKVPPGAYLREIYLDTLTVFDGSTNTGTVTDGTTVFVNAQDLKSLGRETVAVVGKYYPNGGTVSVNMAQTGTATVGAAIASLEYIVLNRMNENGPA